MTKNQRREAARELARKEREKADRRRRLLRWVVPTGVTVAVLAIAAVVVLVVVTSAPPPQSKAGPKNMVTDGILFTGQGGKAVPTTTPALKPKATPSPAASPEPGVAQIISYVDWSCPSCQAFEQTNADWIEQQVQSGKATLEVRPVAILNRSYNGSQYSQRVNTAAACVANFAPDQFLAVMKEAYAEQPAETTSGLTNSQIIKFIHTAGLNNPDVDECVSGQTFSSFVTAATNRFTNDPANTPAGAQGPGTPTVFVNGKFYSGDITDANAFQSFVAQAGS